MCFGRLTNWSLVTFFGTAYTGYSSLISKVSDPADLPDCASISGTVPVTLREHPGLNSDTNDGNTDDDDDDNDDDDADADADDGCGCGCGVSRDISGTAADANGTDCAPPVC